MARIYVEAGSFYGQRSGVGRYCLLLTEQLAKLRPEDQFVLFSFLRPGRHVTLDFAAPSNVRVHYIRWFPGRAFSLLMRYGISLPLELFRLARADVLIFPNFIAWASLLRKKRISIVHDVAFRFYPEYIQAKNLRYLCTQLDRSLHRSTTVIAVSEFTKQDLIRYYNVPAERIHIVHNAVDGAIFNPEAKQNTPQVLKKLQLPEDYLLFVSNVEPRKNVEGLLRAYAQSYSKHKLALIVVGSKGWNDSGIEQLLTELKDLPIHLTGFVDDQTLAALYAGARAFVYPSFYEGFGIPCLEAMASGCPLVSSNTTSIPEIVGDAGVLVDPTDTTAISAAIIGVTSDQALRQQLIARGLKQASRFTWENSALQLSKAIDSTMKL